jgi:alpha-tubulin suppressor-like RCC1 family protein
MLELGHGGEGTELVPRMIEVLTEKKAIGAAAGSTHTAVWTDDGELFTFGYGDQGNLGHGGTQKEPVPRLVEALAGKKVIGAAAGYTHTAAWTAEGELFTFGVGGFERLGQSLCRGWSRLCSRNETANSAETELRDLYYTV